MSDYTINTKCVQAGYTPGNGEPRQIPIIQSTTFHYDTSEEMGKLFDLEMPKTPIPILADEAKIKQTVIVLIDNALKNTDRGGRIKVSVSSEGKQNVVKVFNSGHGIAPEDMSKIFDRFYRADSSRDRNTGGYGLGLSIAQTIAKAHGGKITVYSRVDEYAEFVLSLPKKIN